MPPAKKQTKAKATTTTERAASKLPYTRFTVSLVNNNQLYDLVVPLTKDELIELLGTHGYVRGRLAPKPQEGMIWDVNVWGRQDIVTGSAAIAVVTIITEGVLDG